mgnify:CR=1 FL=1
MIKNLDTIIDNNRNFFFLFNLGSNVFYWVFSLGIFYLINLTHSESIEIVTPESNTVTKKPTNPPYVGSDNDNDSKNNNANNKNKTIDWNSNDSYINAYLELKRKIPARRKNDDGGGGGDGDDLSTSPTTPKTSSLSSPYNTVIRSSYLPENKYPSITQQQHQHQQQQQEYWTQVRPSYQNLYPVYGPVNHQHHHPHPIQHHYTHHEDVLPHSSSSSWHNKPYSSGAGGLSLLLPFLPKKISMKLIFKILLKLILFKMFVKFVAVVCLLLFIPLLESKKSMGGGGGGGNNTDDEMKKIEKIDYITNIIWNSIEKKKKHYGNETTAATGTATTTTKPEPTEEEIEQDKLEAEELQEIKKIADVIDMEPNLPG